MWASPAWELAVSTYDHYAIPVAPGTWDVPAAAPPVSPGSTTTAGGACSTCTSAARTSGKDKQWDATKRIDWDLPVDPANVMGISEEFCPIYGSRQWEALSQAERDEPSTHLSSWLFSQFLGAAKTSLDALMRDDEQIAEDVDRRRYEAELAARRAEVDAAMAEGAVADGAGG
jgi:hypothetical protein